MPRDLRTRLAIQPPVRGESIPHSCDHWYEVSSYYRSRYASRGTWTTYSHHRTRAAAGDAMRAMVDWSRRHPWHEDAGTRWELVEIHQRRIRGVRT